LKSISVDGQQYAVTATDFEQKGREGVGANKRTAEFTGGGAALGAIIGAIAGQGKGAAIGGASGAGAGALTQILTKGSSVKVPAETLMTFKLEKPVRVVERR
jgi:outer membrane lipoprotein SlyB